MIISLPLTPRTGALQRGPTAISLSLLPHFLSLPTPITALSCNKENQHKKAKIPTGTSGPETQLRRRKHARAAPTGSCVVAPAVAVAHAHMHRLAQQGRKQRDHLNVASKRCSRPSNSEPEPMSIEIPDEADPSNFRRRRERREGAGYKDRCVQCQVQFPSFPSSLSRALHQGRSSCCNQQTTEGYPQTVYSRRHSHQLGSCVRITTPLRMVDM